jgi:Sulfotransferase domain
VDSTRLHKALPDRRERRLTRWRGSMKDVAKLIDAVGTRVRARAGLAKEAADQCLQMITYRGRPPHVLVACQPKSGSTFLSACIAALPDFRQVPLATGFDRREQELCEQSLRRNRWRAYVAQHHVRHSVPTEEVIARHHLTVVVLVRNLFDAVVSIRDHLRNEDTVAPAAFFTEQHARLPDRELERAITRLMIPWYVNFYMTWRNHPNALLIRYEEMIVSPIATLCKIVTKAGLSFNDSDLKRAISVARGGETRLNVGVAGRGAGLEHDLKKAIIEMLAFYPEASDDPYIRDMTEKFARASGAHHHGQPAHHLVVSA